MWLPTSWWRPSGPSTGARPASTPGWPRHSCSRWASRRVTRPRPPPPSPPRELEVLTLLTRGLSNKEIGAALAITETTVKTHVSSILSKLGLQDRTQAAVYALKH